MKTAALGVALAGAVPGIVACSSSEVENDGSIRGKLMVYNARLDDGTSRMEYQIEVGGNEADARMLVFSKGAPDAASGSEIKVWGELSGREIIVNRYELVAPESSDEDGIGTSREAIIGGSPYPSRTFAYVLVNIGGGLGNYTEAQATIDLFGTGATDGSTKQWFLENSYGRQDIGGDVVAGLSYSMNGCNYSNLASGLRSQVDQALGTAPQNYLWYFGTRNSSCSWAGLASVGSPDRPARDTWYNASSSCVVVVQEPAHNFGMQHSSSLRCSGNTPFANDPSTCTHDEYGDRHDPMGGACRHTNAWQKGYQGWFGGCNRVRVNQSGTFNLLPIEIACNGIQVLQIPMPNTTRRIPRSGGGGQASNDPVQFYYLELRTRTGFDQQQTSYPTVLVRVGPDYRSRTQTGLHTWILDMNPSTTGQNSFDGMGSGATYMDPAGGLSFTVQSISDSGATINVTMPSGSTGANTCTDGGTLEGPSGPTTCGSGGAGGMGGMGGMAGMAGSGGMAGRAGGGAGGMAGSAGAGGAAGAAGSAGGGAGGLAGSGGFAGSAGLGGAAGAAGAAGSAGGGAGGVAGGGPAGAAGAPFAGSAGVAGGGPAAGAAGAPVAGAGPLDPVEGGQLDPGCGCRVPAPSRNSEATLLFGLVALLGGSLARRRRMRPTAE